MTILVNPRGLPEPPSDIQRRLRQIHEGLSLVYSPASTGHCWLITLAWASDDPRHAMVQRQEISGEALWDNIGNVPLTVRLDDMPGYLERIFRDYPVDRVRQLLPRLTHYNMSGAPVQAAVDSAITEMVDDGQMDPEHGKRVTGRRTKHKLGGS